MNSAPNTSIVVASELCSTLGCRKARSEEGEGNTRCTDCSTQIQTNKKNKYSLLHQKQAEQIKKMMSVVTEQKVTIQKLKARIHELEKSESNTKKTGV